MENQIKNVIVLLILLYSFALNGQKNPDELVKQFFTTYTESGATAALDELYSTNPWMNKATDAMLNLKNQMEGLNEDFVGKYYGYELIVERKISDSYILKSYLVKFDRQPLRYTFQFYKPDDEWKIYSFKYDSSLDAELEESAKLYFIAPYQE